MASFNISSFIHTFSSSENIVKSLNVQFLILNSNSQFDRNRLPADRCAAAQFLKPIHDDVELIGGCRPKILTFDHQEPLAVESNVIPIRKIPFEEKFGLAGMKSRSGLNLHCHHLVAVPVKEFSAAAPSWSGSAVRGDRRFAAGSRIHLHVDLRPSGFSGLIGEPLAIGRELNIVSPETKI